MKMAAVPLSGAHVRGLINLRGQIGTAVGLRELFGMSEDTKTEALNVVCDVDDHLICFQVDDIGDVIEVPESSGEETPSTIPENIRRFFHKVYKMDGKLLSIIDTKLILNFLNNKNT